MRTQTAPTPPAATPASNAMNPGGPRASAPSQPTTNAMPGTDRAAADLDRRLSALTPPQKAAAARQAEILSVVGQGLAAYPYGERRAILDHLTPALAARGVAPAMLGAFDPTDANLAETLGAVTAIRRRLETAPRPAGKAA